MKPNVLKFQSDIKIQVAKQKEIGDCDYWMHPMYCAYYILKHNLYEDRGRVITEDIKRSYKALPDKYQQDLFITHVNKWLNRYAEEVVCADK